MRFFGPTPSRFVDGIGLYDRYLPKGSARADTIRRCKDHCLVVADSLLTLHKCGSAEIFLRQLPKRLTPNGNFSQVVPFQFDTLRLLTQLRTRKSHDLESNSPHISR